MGVRSLSRRSMRDEGSVRPLEMRAEWFREMCWRRAGLLSGAVLRGSRKTYPIHGTRVVGVSGMERYRW